MPSLGKLTRDTLNEKAAKLDIADADKLPSRAAVIDAIEAAKRDTGIFEDGARVISFYGKGKYRRVMVDMPLKVAKREFRDLDLRQAALAAVTDAIRAELAKLKKDGKGELASSALAMSAVQMAKELDDPFNSAHAKSMCAKELQRAVDRLREISGESGDEPKDSRLDGLRASRAKRRGTKA